MRLLTSLAILVNTISRITSLAKSVTTCVNDFNRTLFRQEGSSAADFVADVTDVTDVSPKIDVKKEEGRG